MESDPAPTFDSSTFEEDKARYMKSLNSDELDRSRAGRPDVHILKFLDTFNAKTDFFTTSSCSGRLIVVQTLPGKGYHTDWLFVSHELVENADPVLEAINSRQTAPGAEVWYKMEPPILAICARSVECAQQLMDVARGAGIKRASITGTKGRVMVVIMDTQRMETLVARDGRLLLSDEYVREITAVANDKLQKSWDKIERFRLAVETKLK
eukprot:TRINITY_DN25207_c0_g1_i1.p1 TRINITY_DN25207_c0_g1~~TRINITY_DN25207_c0_g1_i1.p1  ORF type:complete len:210 (-),score=48.12 TRINITY_DN25207_c0_g1_i1:83-712(-)